MRISPAVCQQSIQIKAKIPCVTKYLAILFAVSLSSFATAQTAGTYQVTNIISDGSVPATTMDANFINPWAITPTGTFWMNAQGTGYSYVVPTAGTISFKVSIPAVSGGTSTIGSPTGAVSAASAATGFVLSNGTKASFLFDSLDGLISGWNSKLGATVSPIPVALPVVNNSSIGAVYTGLGIVTNTTGTFLLATDFGTPNAVEVYDSNFAKAKLTGSFTDPNLPANYAPYSIHVLGTQIYVAYALRTLTTQGTYRATGGEGNGVLDIFDVNGNFVSRAITGGNLNAPWGVAIAPTTFGIFGGALLVGNFGDGVINAYNPTTFAYLGRLTDGTGKTLTYGALWDLVFGNTPAAPGTTAVAGTAGTLYFTAGLSGQAHGLLGQISVNPTPSGTATFGLSTSPNALTVTDGSSGSATVAVDPTNGFSGTVSLACTGLPTAATCTFSPSQIAATASAPATGTVTIQTTKSTVVRLEPLRGSRSMAITLALLIPFGSLAFFRRRPTRNSGPLQLFLLLVIALAPIALIAGCSSSSGTLAPSTPVGTTQVTVTATAGTVTQSTVIALTVQ
jgi:uncharacterized protein (TIGR03118 family)